MPRVTRTRSLRAKQNDEAIRDSAVDEMIRAGVDHLSLRVVGQRAGLTHGATYARYEDVDELLADLWSNRLEGRMRDIFVACEKAVKHASPTAVRELIEMMRQPTSTDIAAILALYTSRRIPVLAEEVEIFLTQYLERERCSSPSVSPEFTKSLALFGVTIAQMLSTRYFDWDPKHLESLEHVISAIVTSDPATVKELELSDGGPATPPEDDAELRDHLSWATFRVVGRSGYTGATISRIARRANCSPGAIYKLYESKEDLVDGAFTDLMQERWLHVEDFVKVLDEGVIARRLATATSPDNEVRRAFFLEFALAAAYAPRMSDTLRRQVTTLEHQINEMTAIDAFDRERLVNVVRVVTLVIFGMSFLSMASHDAHCHNFNQVAEPMRRVVLEHAAAGWAKLREMIDVEAA